MNNSDDFDPVWEEKYAQGHSQSAPWDVAVQFLFRYKPEQKSREDISILEVGCGTASNLWFAALEGFDVSGIDAAESAIATAERRFDEFDLNGDLRTGSFTELPFPDGEFDLIIDRGALSCVGTSSQKEAISEIRRCLVRGGHFLYTPYSQQHSSFLPEHVGDDDLVKQFDGGAMDGLNQIRFSSRAEIHEFLPDDEWVIKELKHKKTRNFTDGSNQVLSNWVVITERL